jgi:hypothetical protein
MLTLEGGEEWEGLEGMGEEILRELRPRAEGIILRIVMRGASLMKEILTGARTGRVYRVSRTGALHVASAPGEPPAVMFGNLRNSVGFTEPTWNGWEVSAKYGPGLGTAPSDPSRDPVSYAMRMEYGGIDSRGVKIDPRPYVAPTEARLEPIAIEMMESL